LKNINRVQRPLSHGRLGYPKGNKITWYKI